MDNVKAKLPERCPMLELVTALGGTVKPGFGCHLCLLKDGVFCVNYQLGHPAAVRYQRAWL